MREIKDIALLDLTGASSEDLLDGVGRISNVACILVPESLMGRLMSIPMEHIAATVPIPQGKRVRVMTGQIVLSGEALASEGEDEILVTAGQLVLTSPVQQTSRQIVALGQVIAPTGSETGLGAALSRMSGQIIYYPYTPGANVKSFTHSTTLSGAELANPKGNPSDILVAVGMLLITGRLESLGYDQIVALGPVIAPRDAEPILVGHVTSFAQGGVSYYDAEPRLFDGKETFSAGFFELLDQPTTLILDGKFTFADDVTPALLKAKLKEIIFDGKLIAPRALVPMLQILARQRSGKIVSADEDE